jgi:hypothetical protein
LKATGLKPHPNVKTTFEWGITRNSIHPLMGFRLMMCIKLFKRKRTPMLNRRSHHHRPASAKPSRLLAPGRLMLPSMLGLTAMCGSWPATAAEQDHGKATSSHQVSRTAATSAVFGARTYQAAATTSAIGLQNVSLGRSDFSAGLSAPRYATASASAAEPSLLPASDTEDTSLGLLLLAGIGAVAVMHARQGSRNLQG